MSTLDAFNFKSSDEVQASHDLYVLQQLTDDLIADWKNPRAHRAMVENFNKYSDAFDKLTELAGMIRNAQPMKRTA